MLLEILGVCIYTPPTLRLMSSLFCASFVPIAAELWRSSIKGRACARDLLPDHQELYDHIFSMAEKLSFLYYYLA